MADAKRKRRWQDSAQAIRAGLSGSQVEDKASDTSAQWRQIGQILGGFLLLSLGFGGVVQGSMYISRRVGLGDFGAFPAFVGYFGLAFYLMIRWQRSRFKSTGYYHDAQRYQLPANLLTLLESELEGTPLLVEMDSNASYDLAFRQPEGAHFTHGWLSLKMRVGKTYSVTLQIQRCGDYTGNFARYKCRYADHVTIKVRAPEKLAEPPEFPPFAGFAACRMQVQGSCLVVKAKTPTLKRKKNRQGLATAAADLKAEQLLALLQGAFWAIRRHYP